jgi:putative sterol carrier protein
VPGPAKFLAPEWVGVVSATAAAVQVQDGGFGVRVQIVVTGTPDGDATWHLLVDHEKIVAGVGPTADADVVLTLSYGDAVAMVQGELEPSVAFMQGRMKTAGDPGRVLDVLAATSSPGFRDARSGIGMATKV